MDKKISVIVPVYNVAPFLPRCLDSLLAQTYENLEFLLVNDGSTDNSGAICRDYASRDPRFRLIEKRNGGLSSARNAGLDAAEGDYIAFLDSDDWVEPFAYGYLLELAQRYHASLVCAGRYDVEDATGEKTEGLCPQLEEVISGEELVRRIFHWRGVDSAAWDKLYRADLFREIRYPLGKVTEDLPTTYRIALLAGSAVMGDRRIYNYYHRPGSITISAVSEKTFHYSQHTAQILAHIRERYPALEKDAMYLRVRSLMYDVMVLDLTDSETRQRFGLQREQSVAALREALPFLLKSGQFTRREQRDGVLLALGLYRPAMSVHNFLKKLRSKTESA